MSGRRAGPHWVGQMADVAALLAAYDDQVRPSVSAVKLDIHHPGAQ
jgi:hypothetical protein